ncbi:hypothetical protein ACH50O_21230 [Methylomonas sp. 2BW1-5-20]|uniref:hypothetical protein n=1 Tax=Methylomonas sp. 2BW1-5-20 TaxID=3376686 RepID=UPI00404F9FAE
MLMIIPRRLHIRLSLALILTVLCQYGLGQSVLARYVWCFGIDGHVAMELSGHHHNAYEASQPSSKTSDCTDIAVPDNDPICNTGPSNDLFKIPQPALLWIAGLFLLIPPRPSQVGRLSGRPLNRFIDSGQLALRCTVLLI